jgi:light-regulated signal transduction histidine kinase (bacteriophytochrome)
MTPSVPTIPSEQAKEIRRLSHDLSNALEIIVQANYLLSAATQDESAKQWIQLLDNGVLQAAGINRALREYIVANS